MKLKFLLLLAAFVMSLATVSLAADGTTTEKSQIVEDVGISATASFEVSTNEMELNFQNPFVFSSYMIQRATFDIVATTYDETTRNGFTYIEKLKHYNPTFKHSKKWVWSRKV